MAYSSSFVKILPNGLPGELITTILVLSVKFSLKEG
jgi:hypothetical protein